MALYAQNTRRLFWLALCTLLLTPIAVIGIVALGDHLPSSHWFSVLVLFLAVLFLLSSSVLIWILVFQRSRTLFPGWSVAVGVLLFFMLLGFVTLPTFWMSARSAAPPAAQSSEAYPASPSETPPPGNNLTIDELISRMTWATIAFDVPRTMQLEEVAEAELLLGPSSDLQELSEMLNNKERGGRCEDPHHRSHGSSFNWLGLSSHGCHP
jgi:hypothetical protein